MQNLMLITKMASFRGFGTSGRHRRHLKMAKLYFCTFATSPLAAVACLTKIPGDQCKPVEPVGWLQKCKNTIL